MHRILVVDDNKTNVQALASLLSEKGYHIEYALNGPEALQLVARENFDLILLDIKMPMMDGFEVCINIKSDVSKREIPIIFLTANTDSENLQKAFEIGGQDYVSKPFDSGELLSRVKTHIELKAIKDKLFEVNKWLEEKVEERTTELEKANKRLLEIDKAKSQFLRIISHEIRTPLNGVLGALSLINESDFSEDSIGFLGILKTSANRLEEVSNNALDISRLNTYGEKAIRLEKANIKEIISYNVNNFQREATEKRISIIQSIDIDNELINIDTKHFSTCLSCVLDNAIKYSPYQGSVLINVLNEANNIFIIIKDEGFGFNNEFDMNTIKSSENGKQLDKNPGLGLVLARLIIKAHGGILENGNNEDNGAFVKIILPIE